MGLIQDHPETHQTKIGPRGLSGGAAAPRTPTGSSRAQFSQVASHRRCKDGYIGIQPGSLHLEVGLVPSMRGGSIFQRAPSSPPIKGGSLSPSYHSSFINTRRHKCSKKREEPHSYLSYLASSLV
jgi:hypothetical protein